MNQLESQENDTDTLLLQVKNGDQQAANRLFTRHRDRIRQMVSMRLDSRLAVRVDPSDIVQETMAEAADKLNDYATERPIQFYPWLRNIAWQRLVKEYRRHVVAKNRSIDREADVVLHLSDESQIALAGRFSQSQTSPSGDMIRNEKQQRVKEVMASLAEPDREVLILRYLEQMSIREIADTLGIREDAARQRHSRALMRFQRHINSEDMQQ